MPLIRHAMERQSPAPKAWGVCLVALKRNRDGVLSFGTPVLSSPQPRSANRPGQELTMNRETGRGGSDRRNDLQSRLATGHQCRAWDPKSGVPGTSGSANTAGLCRHCSRTNRESTQTQRKSLSSHQLRTSLTVVESRGQCNLRILGSRAVGHFRRSSGNDSQPGPGPSIAAICSPPPGLTIRRSSCPPTRESGAGETPTR